jgi:hypothetical protein
MKILTNKRGGFIKSIIIIIVAIAILSYYGINLDDIWSFVLTIWNDYLLGPATYLWNLWIQYIWTPFLNSVSTVKK